MEIEELYNSLPRFTNIYINGEEINPIPSDVKLTIFCSSDDEEGFLEDVTKQEAGLNLFIAKKWILQKDL